MLLASLALLPAAAQALETRPYEGAFCEPSGKLGTSPCQPEFATADGMAVVPEGLAGEGDLLVIDAKTEKEAQKIEFSKSPAWSEGDKFVLEDLPPACSASVTGPIEYVTNKVELGDHASEALRAACGATNFSAFGGGKKGELFVEVEFEGELLYFPEPLLSCAAVAPAAGTCSSTRVRTGHVPALKRYRPDGTPAQFSALGTNAIDGRKGLGLKGCGEEAASCDETPGNESFFIPSFAVIGPIAMQVAVAPPGAAGGTEGDIYVNYLSSDKNGIDVFAADGRYLGRLTSYKQGPAAEGAEKAFENAWGIAVGPDGAVYVAEFGNFEEGVNKNVGEIHKYLPTSGPPTAADNVANFAAVQHPCALATGAVPSAGSLFAVRCLGENLGSPKEDEGQLYKLDAETGALEYEISKGNTTVSVDPGTGLAIAAKSSKVQEWEASGATAPTEPVVETQAGSTVEGLAAEPGGDLYLSRSGSVDIEVFGPLFAPPEVVTSPATGIGESAATLNGTVNPKGLPLEECAFEWGEHRAYGHTAPCAESPAEIGEGEEAVAVHAEISELQPGRLYHFRLTARNVKASAAGEDLAFATSGGEAPACANQSLRSGPSAALPDCRAYEQVSPAQKNNAELGVPEFATLQALSVTPQQAAPSGEAVTYHSFTSFGEAARGAPFDSQYVSRRGPGGWTTENPNPFFEEAFTRDAFVGFDPSLDEAAVLAYQVAGEPPLGSPPPPEGFFDLFARDAGGALATITTEAPQIAAGNGQQYCLAYEGASEGFRRVIFAAKAGALRPGDPVPAVGESEAANLYEWTPAGGLELASTLPGGASAAPAANTSFGDPNVALAECRMSQHLLRHAISADGRRMFWTYGGGYEGAEKPLFARTVEGGAAQTVRLDRPNEGVGGAGGEGRYWDATSDGQRVFFTDERRLTADSNATTGSSDLYMYGFEKPEGERLTDLTAGAEGAGVQGVIGMSEDGRFAYFVAGSDKLSGGEANPLGKQPLAGKPNLYVWHQAEAGGKIRFVTTLKSAGGKGDALDWSNEPVKQTARVSPHGRYLAFLSKEALSGFENTRAGGEGCELKISEKTGELSLSGDPHCAEAFLYDFEGRELLCASCNSSEPSGGGHRAPLGPAAVPTWSSPYSQPRYLGDGGRLFFESYDSLNSRDTNDKPDVYEYEQPGSGGCTPASGEFDPAAGGCVFLISSGESEDASYLLDASIDGSDAFFSTRRSLAPTDEDERFDVYDAREGGGFPYESPEPPCDSAEACHQGGSSTGPAPGAATASFHGPGNLSGGVRHRHRRKHTRHRHRKRSPDR